MAQKLKADSFDKEAYLAGYHRRLDLYDVVRRDGWPPAPMVRSAEIILGDTCNARCVFCCAHKKMGDWLPEARAFELLEDARRRGNELIVFSGGEPTVCPYIVPLVARARELGFSIIEFMSNGLRFAKRGFAGKLAAAGLTMVKVSVHGADPATHDALTGVRGAFAMALKGIDNLNWAGVYTSTNLAINRLNYRQLPLYSDLFVGRMGLTGFCFYFGFYSGKFSEDGNLQVPYSAVLPSLKLTLEYLRVRKVRIDWKFLGNFVPCLLPECENVMIDWGADYKNRNNSVSAGGGDSRPVSRIYDDRKTRLPKCRGCVYSGVCYGVDRLYLEKYGDGEFEPVKKERKQLFQPVYW